MPKAKRWWGWTAAGIAGVLVASLAARPAGAAPADDAKAHYQKATAHFAVGEYRDAAVEYEEAFKLKQDPALLYNAAQSFRLAGDNQKALLLYGNLVKLYPASPYAAESKDRIAKIKAEMAAAPPAATPAAPVQPAPAPPPASPAPVAPVAPVAAPAIPPPPAVTPVPPAPPPSATPLVTAPAPARESEPHPFYKRWWFWTAAGAVVAAGIITGVALSSGSSSPWANVSPIDRTAAKQ